MTYEYACSACGHEWEAEQSIREEPLKKCPKCGKLQAKRQISRGAGFILKGGGWYADGYGSSKGSGGGESSGGSESKSAAPTETTKTEKTEPSKPEKPEKKSSKGKTVAA
jgi:putative FmdB family regulatory protein